MEERKLLRKMALISCCNKEIIETCNLKVLTNTNNDEITRNSTFFDERIYCYYCGILNKKGNLHHLGCPIEQCPICSNQLISCDCWFNELIRISRRERRAIINPSIFIPLVFLLFLLSLLFFLYIS